MSGAAHEELPPSGRGAGEGALVAVGAGLHEKENGMNVAGSQVIAFDTFGTVIN